MEETTKLILERFAALAKSDLEEFRQFFRRLRKMDPEQAAEACLLYIGEHGVDSAAQSMALWLGGESPYVKVLLDVDSLSIEAASKAIAGVRELDQQFLIKFAKATAALAAPTSISRALSLVPAIGDYSIMIPWLRKLGQHPELRVRSRSAKLLCELRPNKGLIERQMHSDDSRVRADAVEALGNAKNVADARSLFQGALKDKNHRVVGNALVGLYNMGESDALNEMIELCAHKDHLFRAAMAWAMGAVKDLRAIQTLRELITDNSLVVRKRALNSLAILEGLESEQRKGEVEELVAMPAEVVTGEPELVVPEVVIDQTLEISLFVFK